VFAQHFDTITDAVVAERQVKGWSRAKKEAMIRGEWNLLGIGAAADGACFAERVGRVEM
jgi:putative endonuclease